MIGLSLAFCVRDIALGRVNEDDVDRIIAGSKVEADEDWDHTLEQFQRVYWHDTPEHGAVAIDIAYRLLDAGKIDQPRLRGGYPSIMTPQGTWWR